MNESCYIADINFAVSIHVTRFHSRFLGKVAWIARATVDMGIGLIRVIRVIGSTHSAHQCCAVSEYAFTPFAIDTFCATVRTGIDGCQATAVGKYAGHVPDIDGIPARDERRARRCQNRHYPHSASKLHGPVGRIRYGNCHQRPADYGCTRADDHHPTPTQLPHAQDAPHPHSPARRADFRHLRSLRRLPKEPPVIPAPLQHH